jgi:serine/threonine-protein kinase RsbW
MGSVQIVDRFVRIAPRLELTLPATREHLALIRDTCERFLAPELERAACRESLGDVLLALQEAISNVVRHAYREQSEPGAVTVRLEVESQLLRLTVLDDGPGYDPAGIPTPDFKNPRDGGYGVHLMRSTMSKVSYARRSGRNVLLMEKALGGEGNGTAA